MGKKAVHIPLAPGQSVVLPTKSIKRVFIGLGWENAPGKDTDLDCSIVGYLKDGTRDEGNTVFFGRLKNDFNKAKKGASSIVHTGDVLKGGDDADKKDMERIYVWLDAIADEISCVAFAADVYSQGQTFESLTNAYVRLVNADTNQELARLSLNAKHLGPIASSRVVVLARIKRVGEAKDGLWSLESAAEPRAKTLREDTGPQADMAASTVEPAKMDREGKKGKGFLCPALAVGTAAGIGAATALFAGGALNKDMLNPELFTAGVDFGALEPPDMSGVDMGSIGEMFEGGLADAGSALEGVGGMCGGCCGGGAGELSGVVEGASASLGSAATAIVAQGQSIVENAAPLAGQAAAAVQGAASSLQENASGAVAAASGAAAVISENAGGLFAGAKEVVEGVVNQIT